jgi:ABC-type multidrug transport system ATPase subunit
VAYVRQIRKEFMKTGSKNPCKKPAAEKVKVVVRNLSFAVNKGEVFGLLGPNGAGKTTALSMMTAEVHPTRGKVGIQFNSIQFNISLLPFLIQVNKK